MDGIIYLAVALTFFVDPGVDGRPDMNTLPLEYYDTYEECDKWREDRYSHVPGRIDPVTNKVVLGYFYDCTPQFVKDIRVKVEPYLDK